MYLIASVAGGIPEAMIRAMRSFLCVDRPGTLSVVLHRILRNVGITFLFRFKYLWRTTF